MARKTKAAKPKWPTLVEVMKVESATVDVPFAGACFKLGKTQSYAAVHNGTFPVPVIERNGRMVVPTIPLLRALGIEPDTGRKAG